MGHTHLPAAWGWGHPTVLFLFPFILYENSWAKNFPGVWYTSPMPAPKNRGPLHALEKKLESIIDSNGKDRVSAIRQLVEIRTMGGALTGPPIPNDHSAMISALARVIKAAGREHLREAELVAWPETTSAQTPSNDLDRPPDRGGHLD